MDEQIGRLRQTLRELNISRRTIVFFCSDNGPADSLTKKGVASAGSFKGHKHTMYEGGLLVPACAEWPGVIFPGTATAVRCSTVDYFPTIAKLSGASLSGGDARPMDGIDLMPVIKGQVKERGKDMFFGYRRLHQGIDGKAIISDGWKLLQEAKKEGRIRLYDLRQDPYEQHDVASEMPQRVKQLSDKLVEIENSCQRSRDGADYRY